MIILLSITIILLILFIEPTYQQEATLTTTPIVCNGPFYNSATNFDDDLANYDDVRPDHNKFKATGQLCCDGNAHVIINSSVTSIPHGILLLLFFIISNYV
jgi:hypothetical protein